MTHSRHSHRHRGHQRGNGSPALRWHRRAGLTLAAVFLVVCVTGFFLNHAEHFGLRQIPLRAAWLHRWYGMQPKSEPLAFRCGERYVIGLEGNLYLDTTLVARSGELHGAVMLPQAWVAAAPRELVLFTPAGELIERLDASALPPGPIARLGVTTDAAPRLIAETDDGRRYAFDENFLSHRELPVDDAAIAWSTAEPPPPALRDALLASYRGEGISLHRLMLDVHSGRIFGRVGPYVLDAAALGLLFLTVSGLYSARRTRRRDPAHDPRR